MAFPWQHATPKYCCVSMQSPFKNLYSVLGYLASLFAVDTGIKYGAKIFVCERDYLTFQQLAPGIPHKALFSRSQPALRNAYLLCGFELG